MKSVKITKNDLKLAENILKKAGAIYQNNAFPSYVYMSPKDYKELRKNITLAFKKEYPLLPKNKIENSVGMYLLNLGPSIVDKGLKEGYILVDNISINNEIKKLKEKESNG